MRPLVTATAAIVFFAAPVCGQSVGMEPDPPPPEVEAATDLTTREWSFGVSLGLYVVPDDRTYLQPTVTVDRDWLHLEARYNYESSDTASIWFGYNFGGGEEFTWEVTPMIGAVFGETDGVALGYEATLTWGRFELYSEGEYVWDADDSEDNFFYNWSELTFSPVEWFRFGIVAQRTRLYDAERDIQRGFLVGFTFEHVDFAAYVFNPDDDQPLLVFSVEVGF